ncbi:MAG: porin [Emcibacteraceae bacterium]|nr:porin [Emcibacteraceae bacterium]
MIATSITVAMITFMPTFVDAKASDIDFKLGGFIKVNAALNTNGINGIDDASGSYNADLLFAHENKGTRFGFNSKETRLHGTLIKNDSSIGRIKAYVEGNFGVESGADGNAVEAYGTNNTRFVLRHAYVEVGNFLIGQTISTFIDPRSFLDILDYGGNAAIVFARQTQIRYTAKLDDFTVRVSAENPTANLGYNLITDDQRFPDLVGRIDFDPTWGHFSVAGIAREIRIDTDVYEAHQLTGGFVATANKEIIAGKIEIMAQYIRGGIGHYGAFSAFSDGIILTDDNGTKYIDPVNIQGVTVGTSIKWTEKFKSTFMGSWAENLDTGHNTQTLGTGHSIENVKSLHANLYYNLTEELLFGFEYKKMIGELSDDTKPNVNRYQLTMIFNF